MPPAAADIVPVVKSSRSVWPGSSKWACMSIAPGITTSPAASISSSAPSCGRPARRSPPRARPRSRRRPRTRRSRWPACRPRSRAPAVHRLSSEHLRRSSSGSDTPRSARWCTSCARASGQRPLSHARRPEAVDQARQQRRPRRRRRCRGSAPASRARPSTAADLPLPAARRSRPAARRTRGRGRRRSTSPTTAATRRAAGVIGDRHPRPALRARSGGVARLRIAARAAASHSLGGGREGAHDHRLLVGEVVA